VWQRLATQRQEFGLQPYHVTAMQTLRLEKGYPLYGGDGHNDPVLRPTGHAAQAEEAGWCRHAMT
jgi:glycine cleavage system aminomethyltransferase T